MGRKNYKALIAALLFLTGFASCVKDKPLACCGITPPPQDTGNVYVICEGIYENGDASLYLYRPATDSVFGDLYQEVNHQPLGDIFESMTLIGNNFFLCVNNSNKVVVINRNTWALAGTINISQPRYILPVSSTKAYVSSLYSNNVYIINPQTLQVTGTITMPYQNTEGMLLYNNSAYLCTWDSTSNNIYKVDINTDQVAQTIPVGGYAPQAIALDKEQKLWVLSGEYPARAGALTRLDPATGQIIKLYSLPASIAPLRLLFNNTADTLYFIEDNYYGTADNGVYRMGISDTSLPAQPFIAAGANQYYYGVGIDPVTGFIYISDPKGFIQKGDVSVYTPDGTVINHFATGVGPNGFYFDQTGK